MQNKKKILTILFASILALITVFLIFIFESRKSIQVIPKQNTEKQDKNSVIEEQKNIKEETFEPDTKQEVISKVQASKQKENKINIKQTIKPTTKKATVKIPELKPIEESQKVLEPDVTVKNEEIKSNEEKTGVVIPVKYVTRNTYRYVYTPSNFAKH